MIPHHELNERFKGYQRKARALRVVATSIFCVCFMVGVGLALEIAFPPQSIARTALSKRVAVLAGPIGTVGSGAANVRDAFVSLATSATATLSDALAPLSNIPSQAHHQLAAVSSLPWIDHLGAVVYRAVCPIFRDASAQITAQQLCSVPTMCARHSSAHEL